MRGAQSPRQTQRAQPPAQRPQQSAPSSRTARPRAAGTGQAWPELGGRAPGMGKCPSGGGGGPPGGGEGPGVEEGLMLPLRPPSLEFLLRTVVKLLVFTRTFYFEKVTVT